MSGSASAIDSAISLAEERELRRRIVEEAHLPYVYVPLDPDDRLENDGHPDADGGEVIFDEELTCFTSPDDVTHAAME